MKDISHNVGENTKVSRITENGPHASQSTTNTPGASNFVNNLKSSANLPGNLKVDEKKAEASSVNASMQSSEYKRPSGGSVPPIPPRPDLVPIPKPRKKTKSMADTVFEEKEEKCSDECQQEEVVTGDQDTPLIDFSSDCIATDAHKAGIRAQIEANSDDITRKDHSLKEKAAPEAYPLVDLSEEEMIVSPIAMEGKKKEEEEEEREHIYQEPFPIPIPDVIPYVDPERLRQPPPDNSPSYGRETDALIVRLQEEFPDLSRDDCYARLLHYNHDVERIMKILQVKHLGTVDEQAAQYHLNHCNWEVERALNYIFSKSE